MAGWVLSVRDPSGTRVGVIDTFDSLKMVSRHLGIGTWALEMPLSHVLVPDLVRPGAGIVVELDDVVKFSGPWDAFEVIMSGATETLSIGGVDDLVVLRDRNVHPQPGTSAPPYSVSAYDVRSGAAETVVKAFVDVEAGPGAITARRATGFTVAADTGTGATVTGRGRWANLLTFVTELATVGGIGIQCRNLEFDTYVPVDRSATVELSHDRESLSELRYRVERPAGTFAVVGGGGEGTARTIIEVQDPVAIAAGWPRIELFADRRDTTDTTELTQAGALALIGEGATEADRAGVAIVPIDVDGTRYGTDYELGDTIAWVDPWGNRGTKTVQAVEITVKATETTVVPSLGSINPDVLPSHARLMSLARRTARLEVR